MKEYTKKNGLIVPITKREDMPHFTTRFFECYYPEDIKRFKKIVEDEQGYFEGAVQIPSINVHNQPVFRKYICIYQFHKNIEMEVLT